MITLIDIKLHLKLNPFIDTFW